MFGFWVAAQIWRHRAVNGDLSKGQLLGCRRHPQSCLEMSGTPALTVSAGESLGNVQVLVFLTIAPLNNQWEILYYSSSVFALPPCLHPLCLSFLLRACSPFP